MTQWLDLFPGHAWSLHCSTSLYSLFHLRIIFSTAFRSTHKPLHLSLQALPERLLQSAFISYSCCGCTNPYWASNLSRRYPWNTWSKSIPHLRLVDRISSHPGCHQGHMFSKHLKPVQRLPPDELAVIVMLVKLFETFNTCGSCQPLLSSHICPWRLALILALNNHLQHSPLDINIIQAMSIWREPS